jgi:hypothetical protein
MPGETNFHGRLVNVASSTILLTAKHNNQQLVENNIIRYAKISSQKIKKAFMLWEYILCSSRQEINSKIQ